MPSTPIRPPSNHLVINTHNLSQAHSRASPRSANASAAHTLKDSMRPPIEKRHSYGPSTLGPGAQAFPGGSFHGHLGHHSHHGRARQSLALTLLRILAGAPGLLGVMYSLSVAWSEDVEERAASRTASDGLEDDHECGLSLYWAFLLTTALIQRLSQSYRPPSVVLRVALAHLCSWLMIAAIVHSRPPTEPTRPWVLITFGQAFLLFVIVYLPWFKTQMQAAGFPRLSERWTGHALEDGFMGREINGQCATRYLILPLMVVGLCSWMLIITRGQTGVSSVPSSEFIHDPALVPNGRSPSNAAGSFLTETDRKEETRMVISMIVLSSATQQGYLNRKLFRATTLKLFPSPRNKAVLVKYRFIIGDQLLPTVEREIAQEHRQMGDLLILDTPDLADRKSVKLYKAIEWADKFDFDYLVITDDDVLVRMDTLSGELYKQGKKPYFWKGLVFKNVPNRRLDDMDLKEMPKYTDGTLTTLSRDIVRLLGVPAPRYFVESNAQSLGVWLHGYGIQPVHDPRIQPGAFVCEEDLIAKHFDNEPSLQSKPRDEPLRMIERINILRSELKKNKSNPKFQPSVSICDPLVQKRCAICYSCQGRASNWKLMGFECRPGVGVIVGDNYRRPELLDAKQMDELLNRPPGGISDEIETAPLKDYRPGARQAQRLNNDLGLGADRIKPVQVEETTQSKEQNEQGTGSNGEAAAEVYQEGSVASTQEQVEEDQAAEDEGAIAFDEPTEAEMSEGAQAEDEQVQDFGDLEQGEAEEDGHDESDMPISDQEVDDLERRQDEEHQPAALERPKRSKKDPKKN